MRNLTVFNSDVIPVYTTEDGKRIVIGHELHAALKIGTAYKDWFPRMCEYGFSEGKDFSSFLSESTGGRPATEHLLTLDMAKHIAMIQRTPVGKAIRDKLIALETNVSELSPELRLLINLEVQQKQQAKALADMNQKLDDTCELIALDPNDWRKESQKLLARVAEKLGGIEHVRNLHEDVYKLVEQRAGVSLKRRLDNKRRRLADEGASKSRREKVNRLDVIGDDKKLIEIYVSIVKQMAAKYQVAPREENNSEKV